MRSTLDIALPTALDKFNSSEQPALTLHIKKSYRAGAAASEHMADAPVSEGTVRHMSMHATGTHASYHTHVILSMCAPAYMLLYMQQCSRVRNIAVVQQQWCRCYCNTCISIWMLLYTCSYICSSTAGHIQPCTQELQMV